MTFQAEQQQKNIQQEEFHIMSMLFEDVISVDTTSKPLTGEEMNNVDCLMTMVSLKGWEIFGSKRIVSSRS